jgi:hypothetical protein
MTRKFSDDFQFFKWLEIASGDLPDQCADNYSANFILQDMTYRAFFFKLLMKIKDLWMDRLCFGGIICLQRIIIIKEIRIIGDVPGQFMLNQQNIQ